jgi:hypothetical protein
MILALFSTFLPPFFIHYNIAHTGGICQQLFLLELKNNTEKITHFLKYQIITVIYFDAILN